MLNFCIILCFYDFYGYPGDAQYIYINNVYAGYAS